MKKSRMRRISAVIVAIVFMCSALCRAESEVPRVPTGVWVSVFSQRKVLYSNQAVSSLIETCRKAGISEIYLQVFQSGRAYYVSKTLERDKYTDMVKSAGGDMIDRVLKQAAENNIKVFAWVNLLSLGANESAPVIQRYGRTVLTRDQYDRPSGRKNRNHTDEYYQREDQVFLEPGDPRVAQFLVSVVDEIVTRYPDFSGVHLDYIRYPMTVPFIPGAKFSDYGISYGYSQRNSERFKEVFGMDPLKGLGGPRDFEAWDDWRRKQITAVVQEVSRRVKQKNAKALVSAAVIPSSERAYTAMFQDWPGWLENGLVDYVVLMTYYQDPQLVKVLVKSALGVRGAGKVYAGLGAFLFKDTPSAIAGQYKLLQDARPDGIVVFAYDDLTPEVVSRLNSL